MQKKVQDADQLQNMRQERGRSESGNDGAVVVAQRGTPARKGHSRRPIGRLAAPFPQKLGLRQVYCTPCLAHSASIRFEGDANWFSNVKQFSNCRSWCGVSPKEPDP